MENTRVLVGERIRTLRKERGWSQEELGEKANLHHTYVGAIERGEKNASIDTLDKIADALGTVIVDLFALVRGEMNVEKLKARVIEEVKESSPGMLKLIATLIHTTRSEKAPALKRSRKPRKPEA
jgi:transcriptional regulator with XRE-family HTH domain